MQKKLVVLYFLVLLAFAGLSARLVLINRDNGEQYKRQVLSQQQYSSRTLPFKRGEILDSKGTKLAVSEKVYNLVLDCKLMNEKEEYVEGTIAALTQCFDVSESDIRSYNEQNPTSQYHVLKRQLTYDEIAPFQELQNNEEQGEVHSGAFGLKRNTAGYIPIIPWRPMWWVLPARIMWATMGWRSIIMIFSAALTAGNTAI